MWSKRLEDGAGASGEYRVPSYNSATISTRHHRLRILGRKLSYNDMGPRTADGIKGRKEKITRHIIEEPRHWSWDTQADNVHRNKTGWPPW